MSEITYGTSSRPKRMTKWQRKQARKKILRSYSRADRIKELSSSVEDRDVRDAETALDEQLSTL